MTLMDATTNLGTLAWGERSNGRLTAGEAFAIVAGGAAATLADLASSLGAPRGAHDALAVAREIRSPSTSLARRADALCREVSAPWLAEHCQRSFLFAAVRGRLLGARFDDELLFAASMLHDLGVTERYWPQPGACFAITGARDALAWLLAEGCPERRARVVAEAIAMHLNVTVDLASGVEAHLLRFGTGLDVVGQRASVLPKDARDEIVRRHPRLDFKREVTNVLRRQTEQSPRSRIGVVCRHLPFFARVRQAPFAD